MSVSRWVPVAIAFLAVASPAARTPQAPQVFRGRADVVTVPVSVKDGRRPVTDLQASDFEVFDNGVRQTVEAVSLDQVPIDVTLMLTGYRASAGADHLRGNVRANEVRALLRPEDRLRIVSANDAVRGGMVGSEFEAPTSQQKFVQIPGISIIDGLFYALAWPVQPDRRHLVVAFTDGWDSFSTLSNRRLPVLAGHSDAVLHVVFWQTPNDVRRVESGPPSSAGSALAGLDARPSMPSGRVSEWEDTYRAITSAVERTGGTHRPVSANPDAFKAILEDFRTSYLLRFTPTADGPAGWHELLVRVTRPGSYTIRARKGYER